jgi:hypothetical protein
MKRLILTAMIIFGFAASAQAIPVLQLYIDGAAYDSSTETWVSGSNTFNLWVIGDVSAKGSIFDVQLAAAFKTGETGTITLTPTTAASVIDPSTPSTPTPRSSGGSNTQPTLGDGSLLPAHGIYGPGTSWQSFSLGDFTLQDSKIGDFMSSFPASFPDNGQINVYSVTIDGFSSGVHFDAYDHIVAGNGARYINAPFSHDAQGGGNPVPEPGTIVLLGTGFIGLAFYGRRRLNK